MFCGRYFDILSYLVNLSHSLLMIFLNLIIYRSTFHYPVVLAFFQNLLNSGFYVFLFFFCKLIKNHPEVVIYQEMIGHDQIEIITVKMNGGVSLFYS